MGIHLSNLSISYWLFLKYLKVCLILDLGELLKILKLLLFVSKYMEMFLGKNINM